MAEIEKVTREHLRAMNVGETRTFTLPNAQACDNGKATAYQVQNLEHCKYSVQTDYVNNRLTITKNPV
jgi:3-phenylpropionate/cinnamic acid dioxygenase small subunit